jgi:hypothetical protein
VFVKSFVSFRVIFKNLFNHTERVFDFIVNKLDSLRTFNLSVNYSEQRFYHLFKYYFCKLNAITFYIPAVKYYTHYSHF